MTDFADHFSQQSAAYARHRLTYPPELFAYVASAAPASHVVWDCATGNGQAAHGLRAHFDRVIATDASARQIESATPGEGIEYRVATAEDSGLADRSVDAVTVATAFHWFDHERFAREVKRVVRPGGVAVVWTYGFSEMPEGPRAALAELVAPVLAQYWAPQVKIAWDGYRDAYFPFAELDTPALAIERSWTAREYLAYASTWSAVQACIADRGENPFVTHASAMEEAWGDDPVTIRWPLTIRAGRVQDDVRS